MEFDPFEQPAIQQSLQRAMGATRSQSYAIGIPEAVGLVVLYPLVRYLLVNIGLPWLATLKRYSEVQRQRVEAWIDEHADEHGMDPDAVEAASKKLLEELEQTTDMGAKQQWERLMELLKK